MIIGISGRKQSGKTTAANDLYLKWNDSRVVCFADLLKMIVKLAFGATDMNVNGSNDQKNEILPCRKTAREVMQIVGTDWFRTLDENCWIRWYENYLYKTRNRFEKGRDYIITPDVRFPNEIECIHKLGGKVIRLLRNPHPYDTHESEGALDYRHPKQHFDAVIDNQEMSIKQQNKAVWKIVSGWIKE